MIKREEIILILRESSFWKMLNAKERRDTLKYFINALMQTHGMCRR